MSTLQRGTVMIDRKSQLVYVRPLHRRRQFVLPLSAVAEMICCRIVRAEVLQERLEKAKKKKAKRNRNH
jgi:hypothetical protein